jgi:broad specificity phosphatase PhoE
LVGYRNVRSRTYCDMAPTIHLVRHAQGYHNLSIENQKISDPDLTPFGEAQCATLCKTFQGHEKITHLVASPLRRTLYTCLLSFAPVVERGVTVVALPDAQEISTWPSDIGSAPEKIKAEFGSKVDFGMVQDGWNDKSPNSKYEPVPDKLVQRARDVRLWLQKLAREAGDDAQIVLVTHGGILHFITEDWDEIKPGRGRQSSESLISRSKPFHCSMAISHEC